MKRECFLIINPVSGGYSKKKLDLIINRLSGKYEVKVLITAKAGDAGEFSREICDVSEHPLIAIGGGDGTVNEVINGIMKGATDRKMRNQPQNPKSEIRNPKFDPVAKATLAVIPFGTANVLAKELDIYTVDEAIQKLLRGEEKSISLGMIEGNSQSTISPSRGDYKEHGSPRSELRFFQSSLDGERPNFELVSPGFLPLYFILMAGIGFDGALVERVKFKGCGLFKKLAYVIAGIRELFTMNDDMITLSAEGKEYVCHSAFICNASKYAGNFILAPETDISEPLFQVICVKNPGPFAYLKFSLTLLTGRHLKLEYVISLKALTLEIQGKKPIQIDGEFYGYTPARISAVKSGIKIIT